MRIRDAWKVFVSTTSAPASRYARWIASITSGRGDREVVVVAALALAAEVGRGQLERLDLRAHRAVEDDGSALDQIEIGVAGHPGMLDGRQAAGPVHGSGSGSVSSWNHG